MLLQWDYWLLATLTWSIELIWETLPESLPIIAQAIKCQQRHSFHWTYLIWKKFCKNSQCNFPFFNYILSFSMGRMFSLESLHSLKVQSKVYVVERRSNWIFGTLVNLRNSTSFPVLMFNHTCIHTCTHTHRKKQTRLEMSVVKYKTLWALIPSCTTCNTIWIKIWDNTFMVVIICFKSKDLVRSSPPTIWASPDFYMTEWISG